MMTGHIVIRSSPVALNRRQPLLAETLTPPATPTPREKSSTNVGEVAGGTAAECAVVCCCCPCVLAEFLVLVVYKVPASVCRRIWRKRRQKMIMMNKKKALLQHAVEFAANSGTHYHPSYRDELSDVDMRDFETVKVSIDGSAEAIELDKQMWDQFFNTGFWRSPSQRHT